ncbi:nuclear transport factor 2 family protein [Rhodopseudomonas sp. B29]|uniref:nuclear transport factor 2 family protein n=1 Tax=Rhodopseudomonas sp. B29 TaxID=95607 RepID=UPI0003465E6A|nr:nuclear transport factor 2 family protein [Rhodopseudomonas sp. B29]
MANDTYALPAPLQRTVASWHAAFMSGDAGALRPLLAEGAVYYSPGVFSPVIGRDAALTVLGAVWNQLGNFTAGRTFVAGPSDVCLEFGAAFRKSPLKGVSLLRMAEDGLITEMEVMLRPVPTLMRLAEVVGSAIGPTLLDLKLKP